MVTPRLSSEPADPCLPTLLKLIGDRIRAARERDNLSQEAFAKRAGIQQRAVSLIEHGRVNISAATLLKLARAAKMALHDMVRPP